jgi:hypothetical protein
MYQIIIYSLVVVSLRRALRASRRYVIPLYQLVNIEGGTLNTLVAR